MNPDLISKDPEEIVKIVKQDLKTTLGISAENLSFERITKWNASIPQMILDHDKRIAQLEKELESVEGLHICGNFLTGVGIKRRSLHCKKVLRSVFSGLWLKVYYSRPLS